MIIYADHMYTPEQQALIRLDIFEWLELKIDQHVTISKVDLLSGYSYQGVNIPLIDNFRGIRNPKILDETLSVASTLGSKYDDEETPDGTILYDYQSTSDEAGNTKLRRAFHNKIPIIYLKEISKGQYLPCIDVYVIADDPVLKKFVLYFSDSDLQSSKELIPNSRPTTEIEKKYALAQTKRRVHQPAFRAAVLSAYAERCSICNLQHISLLDAAHILPDSHELGKPIVSNGLALCKIHHAAYDKKSIGISPDYKVKVSDAVLREVDGPMLKHGIQEMNGRTIFVPVSKSNKPNPDYLDVRFRDFLASA